MQHILIIEDDSRVADFLQRGLAAEGYQTHLATHAQAGLSLCKQLTEQLPAQALIVLLDVMLPDGSGLEVCQTLRSQGLHTPILMLTALSTLEDRVAGLRCGADDYLGKPFAFEELLARIEALFRRAREFNQPAEPLLQVGDLRLDRISMRVSRAEQAIHLTPRELALLELLMSAPSRLFSREQILATVWGVTEDPLTNIVDVYIRRLRSKIDEGHAQPLIQTQRGLGYRLESPAAAASSSAAPLPAPQVVLP